MDSEENNSIKVEFKGEKNCSCGGTFGFHTNREKCETCGKEYLHIGLIMSNMQRERKWVLKTYL